MSRERRTSIDGGRREVQGRLSLIKALARRRFRYASGVLIAAILFATFLFTFSLGILVHLPIPPSRRIATRLVTEQLSASIRGSVQVDKISRLHLGGFEAQGVAIRDPLGETVLYSPSLRVHANLVRIGLSVLPWSDRVDVLVNWVRAEHIDVVFRHDLDGALTLGTTFLPPLGPPAPKRVKPSKPPRRVVIDLRAVEIGSIGTKGRLDGIPPVDWRARSVRGSLHAGPDGVRIDTSHFPLAFHGILSEPIRTNVDYHFRSPSLMWGRVLARHQDLALSGSVQLRGIDMWVDLDLPRTDGSVFAPYLPKDITLLDPVEGAIEAHGPLPVLETHLRLRSDQALIDGKGIVRFAPEFEVDLDVDVRRLDLRRVVKEGPKTDLNADFGVRVLLDSKARPRMRVTGTLEPTELLGVAFPDSDVDALVDENGVSGLAHFHEPGMPVRADFTVSPSGKVQVSAVTNIPNFSNAPRLKNLARGYAVAQLEGTYETGEFDARLSVNAGNLSREGVRVGKADVFLRAWGPPNALRTTGTFDGKAFELAGAQWNEFNGTLHGPVATPSLVLHLRDDILPNADLKAGLDTRDRLAAQSVELKLEQGREVATVKTDRVEVRNGVVDLGGMAIDGLGAPIEARAKVGTSGFDIRLVSDRVDLDRLAYMLALPGPRIQGNAAIDVDLRGMDDDTRGCVKIDVRDGKIHAAAPLPTVDASLRASFAGRHINIATNISMGGQREPTQSPVDVGLCREPRAVKEEGVVEVEATASLALAGPPTKRNSWRGITGTAQLKEMMVDLDRVEAMIAPWVALQLLPDGRPKVGGVMKLTGELVRDRRDAPPAWKLEAQTKALSVGFGRAEDARRIEGADLFASASMHRGGLLQASGCVRDDMGASDSDVCDPSESNVLASLELLAELDYQRLYEQPEAWKQVLYDTRIDGRVMVHDRPALALLGPLPLKENELPVEADRASATIEWRGTILTPRVDYRVRLSNIGPRNPRWRAATTICSQGQYDGQRAWLRADLRRLGQNRDAALDQLCSAGPDAEINSIGHVDTEVTVAWGDVLAWPSLSRLPWRASVDATIHGFELSDIPILADNGISGRARIAGGIKDLGAKPQFDIQLGLESLRTGPTVDYDQGNIWIRTDATGLQSSLALVDVDAGGKVSSEFRVQVKTEQVRWEDGWFPTRDGSKPVDIRAHAKKFKVGMLTPFVQPVLSYVDGDLTGTAHATWSPEQGVSRVHSLFFMLEDGAFQVPVIGQEFLSVTGLIQAAGSDRLFVERFQAQSLTGALQGRATLDLKGLDIEHVDASLWTREQKKIRLTFEGIPVGDFYGQVNVQVDPGETQNDVRITFDNVHVDLQTADLRSLQRLDENPEVVVVPTVESLTDNRRPEGATTPWVIAFRTKSPAVIERSDMYFSLITPRDERHGPLLVYPDPETGGATLRGHIVLYDGRVDVVGNFFELEENNARVIFEGDAGDPILNITARWDAPDGTRVFADVTGPLRSPRIQFRSQPAMPQAEILALVLFGTQGQGSGTTTTGSQDGGEGSAARDVGGGVAAAGINMLLQDLSPVNISARIDTSRGQSPSPTVVLQVSRDVTAEATYVSEEASLEKSDRYLISFDWRFLRQWSLRMTRGNAGTSILDVIWQHRY